MALYGALAKSKLLSEFDTSAKKASVLSNLGLPAIAKINVLDGVSNGTATASKALILDSSSELNSIGVIKSVDKIITTAQVKALNATPITVLSAVGAGIYPIFLGAYVFMDYATAAYADDAGEDLVFQNLSAGTVVSQTVDGAQFDGTADIMLWVGPKADDATETNALIANGGFEVKIQTGEWITGDSPLKIRLYYRTVTAAAMIAIA